MRRLSALLPWVSCAVAVAPLVQLDYASYRGTDLGNGVTQWMGIPFAAPPLGDLRFAAPANLSIDNQEYDALSHGPACIGANTTPNDANFSEDCLKLDVFAPTGATADSSFPVFFYIEGGGFSDSTQPPNGTALVQTSGGAMVVVTITYRVGPYGFTGGAATTSAGAPPFSLNNGLKDQRQALLWTRDYIANFGGDPNHIVVGGASAGGGSVVMQLSNPANAGLIVGAAIESAATPALLTASESQFMFVNLAAHTNCAGAADALACMRALDTAAFQAATVHTTVALPGGTGAPVYMYGPTLDFDFLRNYTYDYFTDDFELHVPSIFGDDTNEGIVFTPSSIASLDAADAFVRDQFPGLNASNLAFLHSHPKYAPLIAAGDFVDFAAQLYGDIRYVSPGLFMSQTYPTIANNNAIWTYHWDIGSATHTAESGSIWGGGAAGTVADTIQRYWVSFIKHLDPNLENVNGMPTWEASGKDGIYQKNRILFTDHSQPAIGMETVDQTQWDACSYLIGLGLQMKQ